jgi:hypothetical protein
MAVAVHLCSRIFFLHLVIRPGYVRPRLLYDNGWPVLRTPLAQTVHATMRLRFLHSSGSIAPYNPWTFLAFVSVSVSVLTMSSTSSPYH